jgi:uncharacterized cysteine cluster protein YcgN (CxxCxxCC family)
MQPFWKTKPLEQLSREEWESLCDGCGRCCLFKFQDEDTEEVFYTNVACKLFDRHAARCTRYLERSVLVPSCLTLDTDLVHKLNWMPETCAYRLLAEGKDLPGWHPLVSGDQASVIRAGISMRGRVILENEIDMDKLEEYIIETLDGLTQPGPRATRS